MDKLKRNNDLNLLHPVIREAVKHVINVLNNEGIPFEVFEAFRSPERQKYLYSQGRLAPGNIVTYAQAWRSYHQYGLAVDLVLKINNQWSWDDKGEKKVWWKRMHQVGQEHGLQCLDFETPHMQIAGTNIDALFHGRYPENGDENWAENLESAILSWQGDAPPLPKETPQRPVI
jgi:peptidoglycan LD-endopeptidase CwlK